MSDLPGVALNYETVVAEYFLGLRGAGLMLSPLDLDLVRSWERRGLPAPVVCRGLRRGLEDALRRRPGAPAPRTLRAYRLAVEDEWRSYRDARVGDAPAPPAEACAASWRLATARALLLEHAAATRSSEWREAYRVAIEALARAGSATLDEVEAALAAADAALVRGWLMALPLQERAALGPRCRLRAGARPPSTRPAAYRAALRAHVVDAAREAGLLCLRGSV